MQWEGLLSMTPDRHGCRVCNNCSARKARETVREIAGRASLIEVCETRGERLRRE